MPSASALLELVRWRNAVLAAGGVLLGGWWAGGLAPSAAVWAAALAAVALTCFANAYNDYVDRALDTRAHPERPLPSGRLQPGDAVLVAILAAGVALPLAWWARPVLAAVTVPVLLLMVLYSERIKRRGLAGNVVVAVLASLPFLYGAWSVGRPWAALPLLAVGIPLHLAREIAKDMEDLEADSPVRRTLPVVLGPAGASAAFMFALVLFAVMLLPLAADRPRFAVAVIPAVLLCAIAARQVKGRRRGAPVLLKSAMVWAMVSLLASR